MISKQIHHILFLVLLLSLCLMVSAGCNGDDDDDDTGDDDTADDDDDDNDTSDDDDDNDDDDCNLPESLPRLDRIWDWPTSVLPDEVTSCNTFRNTECVAGTLYECDIYDGDAGQWVDDPDPMLEQMYWYDRYYDLYHRMEGQHSDLRFTEAMWPGTPESEWGDPQYFREYDGYGDAAGWTGTALHAAAARYRVTGTEADYQRMLEHFGNTMFHYEANEIPGMLMRSHFAMLEEGAPDPVGHPGKALAGYHEPGSWHYRFPLSDAMLERLPSYYTEGVEISGTHYDVTPLWMGDASRDMYVRGLPGIMLAYDMLGNGVEEHRLKELVKTEIPCTLNRMKKIRIRNLQSNDVIREAISLYLGADRLITDPGDLDLTQTDTIIGYVMEQPHPDYLEEFDGSCPDSPPMEIDPEYDLNANGGLSFIAQFVDIVLRSTRQGDDPIAWMMFPSINGSDSLFMTQWALTALYLTNEAQYSHFLEQLMNEIPYWEIVNQMGSFYNPKWCAPHFGPSLTYPTLWNLQARIDKEKYSGYWETLATAIMEEERYKELEYTNDVYFGILYDRMVDTEIDPGVADYVQDMVGMLRQTEQYQAGLENKMDPRRNYTVDLIDNPPPGFDLETEQLSDDDLALCTGVVEIFGIEINLGSTLEDDRPRAVMGLPVKYRVPGSFLWAMDPYMLWRDYGSSEGKTQWPMVGTTAAFWMGRAHGSISEGDGQALGLRDTGQACP